MPKLTVINRPLYYGGKEYQVGAEFEATEIDARFLKKERRKGKARAVDWTRPKPVGKAHVERPVTRALEADAEPTATEDAHRPTYRTRRLKAED